MARPAKPTNPEDQKRICDLHVNQGLGARRISELMPQYHQSRVSRLLKKCPEIMDSTAGRDAIARGYTPPMAAIIDSNARSGDEMEESVDDDFDLGSLYSAAYSSPPQRPTLMTDLIDPVRFLNGMMTSEFNSNLIKSLTQLAENVNRTFFPYLYPTPNVEAITPRLELPDKNEDSEKQGMPDLRPERGCCPAVSEGDESVLEPLDDSRLLQEKPATIQSHAEPEYVFNDQIEVGKKEIDGDKTNTQSTPLNQEPPDITPPASEIASEIVKPALRPIEMKDSGPREEQVQSIDPRTQLPATDQRVLSGEGVSTAANNRNEPLGGDMMPEILNVQQAPIPVPTSESLNLNSGVPLSALPLARDPVVHSIPSMPEAPPATNSVIINPKEPEINNSSPSNTFIGTVGLVSQTSAPANRVDEPLLTEATPTISPLARDRSMNASNEEPDPAAKSEMAAGISDINNNAGTDWWGYGLFAMLGGIGAAFVYGVYRNSKNTQTQPPTPSSSGNAQGYSRVNDPNGAAMF